MKHWLWLALLGLMLAAPWGSSSPAQTRKPLFKLELGAYGTQLFILPCNGGERACVIASTTSKAPVVLGMYVYDAHGNCIARDEFDDAAPPSENRRPASDDAAVEWFPTVAATYTVELRNTTPTPCVAKVAFR